MSITDTPIAPWLDDMVHRIVDGFHPDRIILFGSHARGDAIPESDVDLLIVMPVAGSRRRLAVEIGVALADVPIPKDVVATTPEDFAWRKDVTGAFHGPCSDSLRHRLLSRPTTVRGKAPRGHPRRPFPARPENPRHQGNHPALAGIAPIQIRQPRKCYLPSFAVDFRYPGGDVTDKADTEEIMAITETLRASARATLPAEVIKGQKVGVFTEGSDTAMAESPVSLST